jgi:hypothetical protein
MLEAPITTIKFSFDGTDIIKASGDPVNKSSFSST